MKQDSRTMEDICKSPSGFNLQVQQRFLQKWMTDHFDAFKHLLLYHALGSGKSCTAITMAEEYMQINPLGKVLVILPARLRTNFYDELMTDCASERYISRSDLALFLNSTTIKVTKDGIRKQFMDAVHAKYEVISFEGFRKRALEQQNLAGWIASMTANRFVIIDEVHNLISPASSPTVYKLVVANNNITFRKKLPATYTHLFRMLVQMAHNTARMIFLTATPVFNNMKQFYELTSILNPSFPPSTKTTLKQCVEALRGYVSFFPGTSTTAYPSKVYKEEKIQMTPEVDKVVLAVQMEQAVNELDFFSTDDESLDAFYTKERQACLAIMPGPNPMRFSKAAVKRLVQEPSLLASHAPKVARLLQNIKDVKGKHVIYTNFVALGVNVISAAMEKAGYISLDSVLKDPRKHRDYMVYAVWDGSTKDADKQAIKNRANALDNIDGRHLRFVIGSPSIKEGVSLKHVQHMHIMDPVWNFATKEQVEGRCVRFCSHVDIAKDHPFLARNVVIHTYVLHPKQGLSVTKTVDTHIYNHVIPSKYEVVAEAEKALKRVSIEYYLFRKLHEADIIIANASPSPKQTQSLSPIKLDTNPNVKPNKGATTAKVKNTCPKRRRPNIYGVCSNPDYIVGRNKLGNKCCYKNRTPLIKSHCPKKRQPDATTGECPVGSEKKGNKYGEECCYKLRGRK